MPRVLRIINRFNLGGPTYNAAYLTKYLGEGYETKLVGGTKDATEDSSEFILENLGLEAETLPEMRRSIHPLRDRQAYKKLRELIGDYKPDIVHTHASKPGALGRWAAHKVKVPVIVHTFHGHVFHSYFSPQVTAFYKRLERKLASVSTRIIAISEIQKHELAFVHKICPPEKIEVVPLGFDLTRFQDEDGEMRRVFRTVYHLGPDDVAVAIIGRLVPIKNHTLFLRAFKKALSETGLRTKAFVVGDGEMRREAEARCAELGLKYTDGHDPDADVYFTSWVKKVEFVNAGADIVALTSKNEGTPVSLIEAQAAERAVVSTRTGGIEDVVVPGGSALLSPPDDEDAFAENLLELIRDAEMRNRFGKAGREFVIEKFHYRRLAGDMTDLYNRLLA